MKWIALILTISLLIGSAAAEALGGSTYSVSQGRFLNGPDSGSFDSLVQNYWSKYQGQSIVPNATVDPTATMEMWMNEFPFQFDLSRNVTRTTFASGGSGAEGIDRALWNSMLLERETTFNFGQENPSGYSPSPTSTLFASVDAYSTPSSSQGSIISQGIMMRFGI
ncbi:MAG: hypothetical protein JW986_08205 [Methanotrichaceae archaeon]|nr:hypothetical protein [Methanotrichaceae archaeon]